MTDEHRTVHGSSVSISGRAALIVGPSGSGKSALALDLMSRGAVLISDDRTVMSRRGNDLVVTAPSAIAGMIEARGIGILNAEYEESATLAVVVDLSSRAEVRLPPRKIVEYLGVDVDLVSGGDVPGVAAAIVQLLKHGRSD